MSHPIIIGAVFGTSAALARIPEGTARPSFACSRPHLAFEVLHFQTFRPTLKRCGNGFSRPYHCAASQRWNTRRRSHRTGKGEEAPAISLAPLLQQSEDQFHYHVISHGLERSNDANRSVDAMFFGLIAAQAAIYAIVLDKVREYPAVEWQLLLGAFVLALLGTTLTLFVREAPDPESFAEDFPNDPEGTRRQYIGSYISKARMNERFWIVN